MADHLKRSIDGGVDQIPDPVPALEASMRIGLENQENLKELKTMVATLRKDIDNTKTRPSVVNNNEVGLVSP